MLISMRVGSEDDDNIFHLLSHQQLQLPPSFLSYLNARLAVIDTGKARLAKGILEDVVGLLESGGNTKKPEAGTILSQLVAGSEVVASAMEQGDVERVIREWQRYYKLKKVVAPNFDVEPPFCTRLLSHLQSITLSTSITGAGGGGFILLLSARPLVEEGALGEVEAALKRAEAEEERIGEPRSYSLKRVQIDEKGMIGRVQKYSFGKKM
mmetsp:Transcript_7118/g.18381  ORF Transcript_7118/g.18381 Transcript_7118/m.18381 type:complete len:210 (-) Transcript_7118:3606-4235(-)